MTLEQLRIFIAVAEKEHVTQAASVLNLTQSATSAAIATLEARYGIKLFDRIGRGIALTETGRQFLVEARAVVSRVKTATEVLDDLAGLKRGSLTIAASQTVANYWLPRRVLSFKSAYPGIDLKMSIVNTDRAAKAVQDGDADLGFVEGEVDHPDLDIQPLPGDALIVVVGAKHPWAKKGSVKPRDFATSRWILREPGSGTRAIFEASLRKHRLALSDLDVALELPSNEAARAAVETGECATAISELVAAPLLAAKTLRNVNSDFPRRSFFRLRRKDSYISAAERAFIMSLDT